MNPSFPSVSLYVGDLASDVSEGHLFEIFNAIGPVALIRVCRDATARRRSLGYAYVNFYNHGDAERALNTLNNTPIKGKPCRIMWSQRDASERNSGVGNIFIKNLDQVVDHKALYELFSRFGTILSCKVALDDSNSSKGYGFVQYDSEESATKAVQALNGTTIHGKEIFVGPFIPRKERQGGEENFTNLFVKNLDENVDENKLREVFGAYGELTSVVVMTEADGKSKCFGFVNFEDHQHALTALEALNNTVLTEGGKTLFVGKAQKRSERHAELRYRYDKHRKPSYSNNHNNYHNNNNTSNNNNNNGGNNNENRGFNVYLQNLDAKIDDQRLKDEFSKFGTVLSVKVMRDDKGASRGFGFVTYKALEEAQKAIAEMRGKLIEGKHIYVAHRKEGRGGRDNQNSRPKGGRNWNQNSNQGSTQPAQRTRGGGGGGKHNAGGYKNNASNPSSNTKSNHRGSRSNSSSTSSSSSTSTSSSTPQDNTTATTTKPVESTPSTTTTNPTPSETPSTSTSPSSVEELLAQIPAEHQIPAIAERLYPLIANTQGADLAGKITGMLIDRFPNPQELGAFLFDEKSLQEKVTEAAQILNQAQAQPQQ